MFFGFLLLKSEVFHFMVICVQIVPFTLYLHLAEKGNKSQWFWEGDFV